MILLLEYQPLFKDTVGLSFVNVILGLLSSNANETTLTKHQIYVYRYICIKLLPDDNDIDFILLITITQKGEFAPMVYQNIDNVSVRGQGICVPCVQLEQWFLNWVRSNSVGFDGTFQGFDEGHLKHVTYFCILLYWAKMGSTKAWKTT